MTPPPNIRQLYTPLQPTVKHLGGQVAYREYPPDLYLQPYIYCYWELKSDQPLSGTIDCKIVADGCMDVFFDLHQPNESVVVGFCDQYTSFLLKAPFHYAGVRFFPAMLPQLFSIKASELHNQFDDLGTFMPGLARFITRNFSPAHSSAAIAALFNSYFAKHVSSARLKVDNRVHHAVYSILKTCGTLAIERDLDIGVSPRQLQRLFDFYVGDGAKSFSKVVRFQSILKARPTSETLRENKLFFDLGYYDQSHFIKEFKNYYGDTPGVAFG